MVFLALSIVIAPSVGATPYEPRETSFARPLFGTERCRAVQKPVDFQAFSHIFTCFSMKIIEKY